MVRKGFVEEEMFHLRPECESKLPPSGREVKNVPDERINTGEVPLEALEEVKCGWVYGVRWKVGKEEKWRPLKVPWGCGTPSWSDRKPLMSYRWGRHVGFVCSAENGWRELNRTVMKLSQGSRQEMKVSWVVAVRMETRGQIQEIISWAFGLIHPGSGLANCSASS